ncbi:hypothetical protein HMH01_12700 [Halovulum dunhuangense]|uniref:EF-hand domain-containing protein n=1 Tax=Halovulum dunhuangense TaxID=1505036 RepID=A0A849L5A1_9RHOB|nr:hypothetical protein [Halovulum dunhuangense]NNU81297.1 hypothetical protein [Halovulum dunhuangense]
MRKHRIGALLGATALTLAMVGIAVAQDRDGWRGGHGGGHAMGHHDGPRGAGRAGQRLIEAHDGNGDGSVSQEEIDTARADRLARFDTDGNGVLDLAEYEALWLDAMRERMVDRFQAHDDDGDGSVTVAEFGADTSGLVARFDRNGDGVLNAEDRAPRGERLGPRGGN